jgi:hypothetical protein
MATPTPRARDPRSPTPDRFQRAKERGLEMIQIALYAAAAVFIMGILIAAIALFVHAETNNIAAPANGGASAITATGNGSVSL